MPGRETLINALQETAEELGEAPTAMEFNEHTDYYNSHCQDEFGTWNNALVEAGLSVNQQRATNKTVDDFIDDLVAVSNEVGRVPRIGDVDEHGQWNPTTYKKRLPDNDEKSRWSVVLRKAGFDPHWEEKDTKDVTCEVCGDEFKIKEYRNNRRFCSRDCHGKWREGRFTGEDNWTYNSITVECEHCGSEFDRIPFHVERNENQFCSTECMGKWNSENNTGENHPRWKGGYGDYGEGWNRKKREAVRERDGYECQACGKSQEKCLDVHGKRLDVHHIRPATDIDDAKERNAMNNLVSLCATCHQRWEGIPLRPTIIK